MRQMNLILKTYICFSLTLLLLSCSSDASLNNNGKISLTKQVIQSYITQNNDLIDKLECQTLVHKESVIYWRFANTLNKIIVKFLNTRMIKPSEIEVKAMLMKLNLDYHHIIDSTLNSADIKMFPDKGIAFLNEVKFSFVTSADNEDELNYLWTCQQVLSVHSHVLELNRVNFSHDNCFKEASNKGD
jgi:hypothetical protein